MSKNTQDNKCRSCGIVTNDISGFCSEKCESDWEDKQPPQCDECSETKDVRFERNNGTTLCRPCFNDFWSDYSTESIDKIWNGCIVPTKRTWDMAKEFPPVESQETDD